MHVVFGYLGLIAFLRGGFVWVERDVKIGGVDPCFGVLVCFLPLKKEKAVCRNSVATKIFERESE